MILQEEVLKCYVKAAKSATRRATKAEIAYSKARIAVLKAAKHYAETQRYAAKKATELHEYYINAKE